MGWWVTEVFFLRCTPWERSFLPSLELSHEFLVECPASWSFILFAWLYISFIEALFGSFRHCCSCFMCPISCFIYLNILNVLMLHSVPDHSLSLSCCLGIKSLICCIYWWSLMHSIMFVCKLILARFIFCGNSPNSWRCLCEVVWICLGFYGAYCSGTLFR